MIPMSQHIPEDLRSFCENCSRVLKNITKNEDCIEFIGGELPSLLRNTALIAQLMKNIVDGGSYPDVRRPTMFDNELLLHLDGDQLFSLRIYLWGPREFTYPHDHNSWGVIGAVTDGYGVINYRREDDGSREGYARLVPTERLKLLAGETTFTLPFDEGIHKTGNPTDETIVTVHFYGKSLPRGYLHGFDIPNNRVYRVFPPRMKKKILAAEALKGLLKGLG